MNFLLRSASTAPADPNPSLDLHDPPSPMDSFSHHPPSRMDDPPSLMDSFSHVPLHQGSILIPFTINDIQQDSAHPSLRPLDRSFVFPGEQLQILAFFHAADGNGEMSPGGESATGTDSLDLRKDATDGESMLRRFQNSHFFVRIAESGEPLWSRKSSVVVRDGERDERRKRRGCVSSFIDRGDFNPNVAGGVARSSANCSALSNGDIVVSLHVNVVDSPKDAVMEILQFERRQDRDTTPQNSDKDPYGDLLKWLIPLDNSISQQSSSSRTLPPPLSSTTGISSTSQRSVSATSGSQLFSFGHFRSYSMSALPPNTAPVAGPIKAQTSKPSFELEDWDSQSAQKGRQSGAEELLSFRGVTLERDRFSVQCGLEGIYFPGKLWRRKLEIIQPVQIHSFAADCNTDDLLCVQIKNVAPAHTPEILIYVDAITIVFEETGKSASPSAVPIACIEAGTDHSLPNLTLRRGEEHSFILKPTSSVGNTLKPSTERKKLRSSSLSLPSVNSERKGSSNADQYAVMVSCRCNYTESRLFFKQQTKWRPRASRDLMISVASEMSGEPCGPHGRASQLPVQVLTLQASNLGSEDLGLTVLAPTSLASPPSMVSLNSTPTSPVSPFLGFSEFTERVQSEKRSSMMRKLNSLPPLPLKAQKDDGVVKSNSFNEHCSNPSDVVPKSGLGCTHLWLQSRVPLGCVPARSTATIKLELLPLTDGIITLDTLQIDVKEKGRRYVPQQSLKINATSSVSTALF